MVSFSQRGKRQSGNTNTIHNPTDLRRSQLELFQWIAVVATSAGDLRRLLLIITGRKRMLNLPARVPNVALRELTELFVPSNSATKMALDLRIQISDSDLSIRGLATYLSLVDRVFGRLSETGLRSYAQRPADHIRIGETRVGSLELILRPAIDSVSGHTALVVLWLFLKYLPSGVKSLSEVVKNAADSYKSFNEGALAAENRRRLRKEMEVDEQLQGLDKSRIAQLATLIDALRESELKHLPSAERFARDEVQSVELIVHKE